MLRSINPATNETVAEYEEHSEAEVEQVLRAADAAATAWTRTSFADRSALMRIAAIILRERTDDLARQMALEMGKPITDGKSEVEKCAWVCEYYADHAEAFLAPEHIATDASRSYVAFRPLGVVLAVMPWNFPLWQVFRFAAPTLMAGNGGLLKHASSVTGSALAIEEIFRDAGFPPHLFRTLKLGSDRVASVIKHPVVKAVTLTGSVGAGRAVASEAGSALKKTVLELGGSDPYLILHDADLDLAARTCVASRLINSGQSCIAAKRFIVVESVREAFEDLCVEHMQAKVMGDPLLESTDLGPQAKVELRDQLHEQVSDSISQGATCLLGGVIPKQTGAWYPPTILSGVEPGMRAFDEELFGPVAAIVSARDDQEAIALANASPFGLGAAVFTKDLARGEHIAAEKIEAGCCFVNAFVKSDPRLPFGGIGDSGYGRELSHWGIREFVNAKTVYLG